MAVSEWFPGFLRVHIDRMARKDYPDVHSEFWKLLRKELVRSGVNKEAANKASIDIALDQPEQPSQHNKRFLDLARRHQAELHIGNPNEDKAAAMAQSLNCEWCSGNGLALIERIDGEPFEVATAGGMEYESPTLVVMCRCSMAAWLRSRNKFRFTELSTLLARYTPVIPANTRELDDSEIYARFTKQLEREHTHA